MTGPPITVFVVTVPVQVPILIPSEHRGKARKEKEMTITEALLPPGVEQISLRRSGKGEGGGVEKSTRRAE